MAPSKESTLKVEHFGLDRLCYPMDSLEAIILFFTLRRPGLPRADFGLGKCQAIALPDDFSPSY